MLNTERTSLPLFRRLFAILISILLFVIEISLIVLFAISFFRYEKELYTTITGIILLISEIVALAYIIYIIHKPISTNYKLTWSILILLLPIVFCPIYTLNSTSRRIPKRKRRKLNKILSQIYPKTNDNIELDADSKRIIELLNKSTYSPVYENTSVKFFNDIKEKHNDMLEEIKNAKNFILLEYFIINKGKCFDTLFEALETASNNGCKIYIIYDDVGSKGYIYKGIFKKLRTIKNLKLTRYQPLGLNLNLLINYRDHRKICVIDGKYAYCGGDNISDEYIHEKERFGYWRDNALKYHGDAVKTFTYMFYETWYLSTKQLLTNEIIFEEEKTKGDGYIIPFGDGPNINNNPAYDLFSLLIMLANKSIYISTPYLIIDDALLNLLCLKAKSGVDVRILTPGIPDKLPIHNITRSNYKWHF